MTTIEGSPEHPAAEGRGSLSVAVLAVRATRSWDGCCGCRAVGDVKGFEYFFHSPFYLPSSSKM